MGIKEQMIEAFITLKNTKLSQFMKQANMEK